MRNHFVVFGTTDRVYIGIDESVTHKDQSVLYFYNPAQQQWGNTPPLPGKRTHAHYFSVCKGVSSHDHYAGLGVNFSVNAWTSHDPSQRYYRDIYQWNEKSNRWNHTLTFPDRGGSDQISGVCKGKLYIGMGYNDVTQYNLFTTTMYQYDFSKKL